MWCLGHLRRGFSLDGVVVLVDADQFPERFNDPATAASVETQLVAADLFVLTKLDLASSLADVDETRSMPAAPVPPIVSRF